MSPRRKRHRKFTGLTIPKFPTRLRARIRARALLAGKPMYDWLIWHLENTVPYE